MRVFKPGGPLKIEEISPKCGKVWANMISVVYGMQISAEVFPQYYHGTWINSKYLMCIGLQISAKVFPKYYIRHGYFYSKYLMFVEGSIHTTK